MSSISSQELAASASDSNEPGCGPSPSVRLSRIAALSSRSIGQASPATPTCESSPPTASGQTAFPWMSSVVASPAKTSPLLARALGLREAARAYGRSTPDLLASFDPATSSWRTSQHCLVEGLTVFSETWPRSGSMRNGTAYQRQPLVPLTKGTESGLWPTPTKVYTREKWTAEQLADRQAQVKAETLAKGKHHTGNGFGLNLAQAVRLWPTPTKRDYRSGSMAHWERRQGTRNLNDKIALEGNGGLLNPTWVEWLMGFPLGWTELAPSVMRSFRKSRKQSVEQS